MSRWAAAIDWAVARRFRRAARPSGDPLAEAAAEPPPDALRREEAL